MKAAQADIRQILSGLPGPILTSNGFLTERINETLSGYRFPVVVHIFGTDLDQLDQQGGEVARVLGSIRGAGRCKSNRHPECRKLWCGCDKTESRGGASTHLPFSMSCEPPMAGKLLGRFTRGIVFLMYPSYLVQAIDPELEKSVGIHCEVQTELRAPESAR